MLKASVAVYISWMSRSAKWISNANRCYCGTAECEDFNQVPLCSLTRKEVLTSNSVPATYHSDGNILPVRSWQEYFFCREFPESCLTDPQCAAEMLLSVMSQSVFGISTRGLSLECSFSLWLRTRAPEICTKICRKRLLFFLTAANRKIILELNH